VNTWYKIKKSNAALELQVLHCITYQSARPTIVQLNVAAILQVSPVVVEKNKILSEQKLACYS
jgi:hypothetical protein